MRTGPSIILAATFVAVAFAGCVQPDPFQGIGDASLEGSPIPPRPRVVVADIDTGINPYHQEFRDDSVEAYAHPSLYIPGYPADVKALNLTFDAEDYEAAVLADCDVWQSVEPETPYWIPGTRIIAAITFQVRGDDVPCEADDLPGRILDRGGHGTMTTSRVAGATYSLCPDCKIASIQGFSPQSMRWAAEQSWIDLQTNSWGDLPDSYVVEKPRRDDVMAVARAHPTFVAGGNGLLGFFGVSGHPAYFDNIAGPDGIIMVGGHDGGRFTPWTMTMPHVVADANQHPAAYHDSLDGGDAGHGGGTSGATPFAAGTFARILLEARTLVGDHGVGVRDGNLVVAPDTSTLPAAGALSDGTLSIEELKTLFYRTANPRPVRDGDWDGESCDIGANLGCILYPTTPVEWGMIPTTVPAYYFVGYGQVGAITLEGALAVMRGDAPLPERPSEDTFHGFDSDARQLVDA